MLSDACVGVLTGVAVLAGVEVLSHAFTEVPTGVAVLAGVECSSKDPFFFFFAICFKRLETDSLYWVML